MLKKLKVLILMIVIVLFTLPGIVLSDETGKKGKKETEELGEIEVTATRTKRTVKDVPSSVTVITRQDIEASPFEKVEDILRANTGVNVDYHYGMHTVSGNRPVNLRGTGGYGDRTLVLVDGIPQNNANNGWVEWSQIPKESIERIEVVRGSFSALYGSHAMGGVINIITRKPEKTRETIIEQKYGSMNTSTTKLVQNGRTGKFRYYLTAGYEETDGYKGTEPEKVYDIKRFEQEDKVLAKLMYDIDDTSSVTLGFSRYHNKIGRGREYFYGYTENNRTWLTWSRDGEKIDWQVLCYVNNDEWDAYFDKSPTYDCLYSNEKLPMLGLGGSIQSSIDLSVQNTLTWGIDYKHGDLDKKDKYYTVLRSGGVNGKQDLTSPFLNDEVRLLDKHLIVSLGGRYDQIKAYDGENWDTKPTPLPAYANDFPSKKWSEFCPKLGAVYHLSEVTTLKSSIGEGFKAPSLYELYTSLTRGPLYIQCNPELKPEKIVSYDLGVEHRFRTNLSGKLTLYQSQAKDFIGYNTLSATRWERDNITNLRIQGVETGLVLQINPVWTCSVDYTYNKSEIRKYIPDPTVEGNYLAETPHNTYRTEISYHNSKMFDLKAILNHLDKRYADNQNTSPLEAYSTFSLGASIQFSKYSQFSLTVENLFDKEYTLSKGADQDLLAPGKVVSVSLNINF